MDDPVGEARALLDRWSRETWGARRGVGERIAIRAVDAAGPLQVILRTSYERRWVELQHRATGASGTARKTRAHELPSHGPPVDLWVAAVEAPRDGRSFSTRLTLADAAAVVACPECTGWGRVTCRTCGGAGTIQSSDKAVRCHMCQGRGETDCPLCLASGRATATPILNVECGTAEQVHVIEDDRLPLPVFFALQSLAGGPCVYQEESVGRMEPRLGAVVGGGGAYRGDVGRHSLAVNDAVNRLLAAAPVEGSHEIRAQHLEVRRTPAFRIDPARGRSLWVFGDPPQVWPVAALRSPVWWMRRAAPWAAGVATIGGAIAASLLGLFG